MEKKSVINTTKEVQGNPMGFLADQVITGKAIENQEAQGQRSFVGSDTLPTDIPPTEKETLEKWGVKFLGAVEGDPIFQYVQLPQGWKKVPTNHSMWSNLVDDRGRGRAGIFYKAAFYDRSAHLSLDCRYQAHFDYDLFNKKAVGVTKVYDGTQVIFQTEPMSSDGKDSYHISDICSKQANDWLDKNYPDWKNPAAYWD